MNSRAPRSRFAVLSLCRQFRLCEFRSQITGAIEAAVAFVELREGRGGGADARVGRDEAREELAACLLEQRFRRGVVARARAELAEPRTRLACLRALGVAL